MQIRVPRFQISGNYTLSLAANGVSQQSIEGEGLEYTDPLDNSLYAAKVIYIPYTSSAITTASIVAIPSTLEFTPGVSTAQSQSVKVLGLRANSAVDITTSCSFTVSPLTSASFTAGLHTGIFSISASTALAGISTASGVVTYWDTVSSASRTDSVNLTFLGL
jgi:hypothetical protein